MYDELALELAERRHGVVARWELRRLGVSGRDIDRIARSRHWEAVTSRILVRRGSTATVQQRVAVAALDSGAGAVVSHLSAARLWGLTGCPLEPVHVVTTTASRRRSELSQRHQVRRLPETWTTVLDGIPVVRPELCALQIFAACRPQRAERLVDSLWAMRLCSGPSIAHFLADMGRMGRNGTAGLRIYLDERGTEYIPPATGVEGRVASILAGAGIRVERQRNVGSQTCWTGRVDMEVIDTAVVVEVQSQRYHTALTDRLADAERRRRLEAAGFVWVEVWDDEVWSTPWTVVRKVRTGIDQWNAAR